MDLNNLTDEQIEQQIQLLQAERRHRQRIAQGRRQVEEALVGYSDEERHEILTQALNIHSPLPVLIEELNALAPSIAPFE
ncbi:MAG: hypothetical protein QNJ46_11500 [Leptolyngbyaceae cyanobacterium MO_188.B28]|nr:hypothetical protein [Leptolyngbyaceae cyanobacterium MO_188.B28]